MEAESVEARKTQGSGIGAVEKGGPRKRSQSTVKQGRLRGGGNGKRDGGKTTERRK